jgi:hypothetical protein
MLNGRVGRRRRNGKHWPRGNRFWILALWLSTSLLVIVPISIVRRLTAEEIRLITVCATLSGIIIEEMWTATRNSK